MSSEDEFYPERSRFSFGSSSSKRPRRRASSPGTRRRFDPDCLPRRCRRSKRTYPYPAPRLAGLFVLLILVAYEVIVLRSAVSPDNPSSTQTESDNLSRSASGHELSTTQSNDLPQSPESRQIPTQGVSKPYENPNSSSSSSFSSSSSNARILASEETSSTTTGKQKETFTYVPKEASTNIKVTKKSSLKNPSSVSHSKPIHLPESAIEMETQGADDDPDFEPPTKVKQKSSAVTSSSNRASHEEHIKSTKTTQVASKVREPGAGENFWNWFQETKGNEKKAVSKSLPCPEDNKRLCQMFYKYIRKYKIRKVFDVSCEKNLNWIGGILKKASNELWGFKYYCSLWNTQSAIDVRNQLEGLPYVEFDDGKWWRAGFAEDTELLFAWDTLAHLAYGRVWNFFVKARKQEVKYILVDNYPGILNDPSPKRDFLNLRKHPFRFPSAKEVAQNVTEPGETAKRQLLFYETSMLPDNLQ